MINKFPAFLYQRKTKQNLENNWCVGLGSRNKWVMCNYEVVCFVCYFEIFKTMTWPTKFLVLLQSPWWGLNFIKLWETLNFEKFSFLKVNLLLICWVVEWVFHNWFYCQGPIHTWNTYHILFTHIFGSLWYCWKVFDERWFIYFLIRLKVEKI